MARVGLVLKIFSALCLAVLITLCIFHGVLSKVSRVSKVSNKEISGVSLSEKVAVSTVIFFKKFFNSFKFHI